MGIIENFEKLLEAGKDTSLLRFTLGQEYLKAGDRERAATHLQAAVCLDARYSAAWKLLGKALAELGRGEEAKRAYEQGIAAADIKGDKQAAKEMRVFLRRLNKPVA